MGTISITTPSDGQTIDASDVATPLNTIVSELNGSIDSDNIASGGVVPNNLTSGTGTSWTWQSWSPTLTNLTEGNGTVAATYIQIGKTVHFKFRFTLGSTSAVGSGPTISLPVTAAAEYGNAYYTVGHAYYDDATSGTTQNVGQGTIAKSTSTLTLYVGYTDTTPVRRVALTASIPFTWTTGDIISVTGTYEAA